MRLTAIVVAAFFYLAAGVAVACDPLDPSCEGHAATDDAGKPGFVGNQRVVAELRAVLERRLRRARVADSATHKSLVGRYTQDRSVLTDRVGPLLTGHELYLFSDGSYVATEWGCVQPETIEDKGTWSAAGAFVSLRSDTDITWQPRTERQYIVLFFRGELLLLGVDRSLASFISNLGDDPEFQLLIHTQGRVPLPRHDVAKKNDLLREAWNPEFYMQ